VWEDGGLGDKFVTKLLALWVGFQKNWHCNMVQKVLQDMSIGRIKGSFSYKPNHLNENPFDNDIVTEENEKWSKP
jgi:hypothetical protein